MSTESKPRPEQDIAPDGSAQTPISDERSPADGLFKIAATVTGASILGIRSINRARTHLIERSPTAGHLVDESIVLALRGVEPGTKLTADVCETAATLTPQPIADMWRLAGNTATAFGRVVRLTGLDQPAPTETRSRQ